MLNVFEKKCYQNGNNSVCVIKFNIDSKDKIYKSIAYKTFCEVFEKFRRKYKKIATIDDYNDVPCLTTFTVVGKAKCSPDDEFDADKGMELAMQRAYQKVNAYNMKFIDMLQMELSDVMSILNIKHHAANRQLMENFSKIQELSK